MEIPRSFPPGMAISPTTGLDSFEVLQASGFARL